MFNYETETKLRITQLINFYVVSEMLKFLFNEIIKILYKKKVITKYIKVKVIQKEYKLKKFD